MGRLAGMRGARIVEQARAAAGTGPHPGSGAPAALASALLAAALLAAALVQVLSLGPAYPVKVLLVLLAGAALARRWPREHGAPLRLGAADRITLARAVLVALVLALAGERTGVPVAVAATALAALAAALDALDGHVARRTGTASAFGARFDMETDALLILALSLLALAWHKAGPWVLAAGLARYAFLAAALVLPWMRRPLPPSTRRQAACVLQVVALIACVSPVLAHPVSAVAAGAGVVALAGSFGADILWLWQARRAIP